MTFSCPVHGRVRYVKWSEERQEYLCKAIHASAMTGLNDCDKAVDVVPEVR